MSDEQRNKLLEQIKTAGVDIVYLQFTDIAGAIKTLTIPASRLFAALDEGVWFDGSCVEGVTRVAESDLYLRPDPSTFVLLPWEATPAARMICDLVLPDGTPFPADPRNAMKSVLAEAAELGFEYRVALEVEFFVFEDRGEETAAGHALLPVDSGSYFGASPRRAADLYSRTMQAISSLGFTIETTHHEVAPGQHEMDVAEMDALKAADAMVTLKWALKAFGQRQGLMVSFMPKPIEGIAGSGLHIQQALIDQKSGKNAFFDPAGLYQLSKLGGYFIAGQLAHARGMCAVIAPLVNSYKRLMGGAEAPARISWARTNRGALIRVPEAISKTGTHVELRAPDPSCNPYLALAAMLKAGLDGIKNEAPLPEPVEQFAHAPDVGNYEEQMANPLPETLHEALEEMQWDSIVRAALGEPIYEVFLAGKEQEWLAYRRHISRWELEHYLGRA